MLLVGVAARKSKPHEPEVPDKPLGRSAAGRSGGDIAAARCPGLAVFRWGMGLAGEWTKDGRLEDARDLLRPVYEDFSGGSGHA